MQTKRIIRITLILFFITGIFCVGAIAVGMSQPPTIIVAVANIPNTKSHQIALIDINRNSPIFIPFPIGWESLDDRDHYYLHQDGHKIFLPATDDDLNYKFAVWDFWTGELVYSPDGYTCHMEDWLTPDILNVYCRERENEENSDGDYYIFNIETGFMYQTEYGSLLSPQKDKFMRWSGSNLYLTSLQDNHTVQYTVPLEQFGNSGREGPMQISLARWFPDGQSILIISFNLLMRYTLADQSLQVIFDEYEDADTYPISISPRISPDGEWIVWNNNFWATIDTVHVATGEYKSQSLTHRSMYVETLSWSPDSQYIVAQFSPREIPGGGNYATIYYLFKPDASFNILLTEDAARYPVWSPDNQFIAYYGESNDYLFMLNIEQFLVDGITPLPLIESGSHLTWLPNNEGVIFIYNPNNLRTNQVGYYHPTTGLRSLTHEREFSLSVMTLLRR